MFQRFNPASDLGFFLGEGSMWVGAEAVCTVVKDALNIYIYNNTVHIFFIFQNELFPIISRNRCFIHFCCLTLKYFSVSSCPSFRY